MGNEKHSKDDTLAVAHLSFSENNEVFSERTINFVKGAIEIVTDVYQKNKK